MSRERTLLGVAAVAVLLLCAAKPVEKKPPPTNGEEAFVAIASVLQSPRCMNCHPAGNAPLNGDDSIAHRMNISRESLKGLQCQTCHRNENGKTPHSPPGVAGWRLPDPEMPLVFQGHTPHSLCEQLKDPKRNGNRSLAQLREHMGHDPFVAWGWNPGPGRSTPPLSHDELMSAVDLWIAKGAPCPN
jgi:hypothetical protein